MDEHQELVPHINEQSYSKIIHIDQHQDICYPTKQYLNPDSNELDCECGTFLYFIENRKEMDFVWYYPDYNYCIERGMGFCMATYYHPEAKKNWIFKTQKRTTKNISEKELEDVTAVGIAFSFDYLDISSYRYHHFFKVLRIFYDWFGKEKVNSIFHKYISYETELNNWMFRKYCK